jgi:hypothetical protein
MPSSPWVLPHADRARDIVTNGPSALKAGIEAWQFGKLWSLSKEEHQKLEIVRDLIKTYLDFSDHKRPLCIAVFGPPGSGKSTAVKAIFEQLNKKVASLARIEFNLTQLTSTEDLAEAVATAVTVLKSVPDSTPFIFFDEFDAMLRGAPLGWLSWFLAPMQDGRFILGGNPFELAKAVYVFAGGTAATMEEFGTRDDDAFRLAKGPDFVSRLQTSIDVRGPNDTNARELRRGMALRFALEAAGNRTGKPRQLEPAFVDELANVGRYRHGQRSVEAVITMMAEPPIPGARSLRRRGRSRW